jgi:hypothetical protein
MRIPLLLDLHRVRSADAIRVAADSPLLDRRHVNRGPLINRVLAWRLRSTLRTRTARLPSALPRDDVAREQAQAELRARLDALPRALDNETLERLAAAVRRDPGAPALGPLAQQAVGRLFVSGYRGDAESWQAALDFDAGVRSGIPRLVWLWISGRLTRARRLLADRVGGDPSGVHATGIAVHTLVRSLERMTELWRAVAPGAKPTAPEAVAASLRPPARVVRQAVGAGTVKDHSVRGGTIAILELDSAFDASSDPDLVFLSAHWSSCPADGLVARLLAEVWASVTGERRQPWFPPTDDLRVGATRSLVARRAAAHRLLAGAWAAVHAAGAILLIAAPQLVGFETQLEFLGVSVALLLVLTLWGALLIPAPLAARRVTAGLLLAQIGVGIVLIFAPAPLRWVGFAELAAALLLGWTWWRLLIADLMTRP